jgi:peroxiredoxin
MFTIARVGMRRIAILVACTLMVFQLQMLPAYAAPIACSVSISPTTVEPSSGPAFTISVTNTGTDPLVWVDMTAPDIGVTYAGSSISNWSTADHDRGVTVSGNSINPGDSYDFQLNLTIGLPRASGNWSVTASSDGNGVGALGCGGSKGLSISGHPDFNGANGVSNISATSITSSRATITWDSDFATSSFVYYGANSSYASQSSYDANLAGSHSVLLTGLSPNTTYHFQVAGTDGNGSFAYSMDNTFVTLPAPTSSGSNKSTGNSNPGQSTTTPATVSRTGVGQPPGVMLATPIAGKYSVAPKVTGSATDDKGVTKVEYTTDGGANWLPVDVLNGAGTTSTTFEFMPSLQLDGDYSVMVRASDADGNSVTTASQKLIIDRLPPIVGASTMSVGPQAVVPDGSGIRYAATGIDQRIALNAVGGPNKVVIEAAQGSGEAQSFTTSFAADIGLWLGSMAFHKPGTYRLTVKAVDGAGNTTSRSLGSVVVEPSLSVVDSASRRPLLATVEVYYRNADTNDWVLWDAGSYGQQNPLKSGHGLYLPGGTYYLKFMAAGHKTMLTKSFTLKQPTIISDTIALQQRPRLGPFQLPSWGLGQTQLKFARSTAAAKLPVETVPSFSVTEVDGTVISSSSLRGKPTIVVFFTTWSTAAKDQLSALSAIDNNELNTVAIGVGDNAARLSAYLKLAGYEVDAIADTENKLAEKFGASAVPATYFINRRGEVKKVVTGLLSKEELIRNVAF